MQIKSFNAIAGQRASRPLEICWGLVSKRGDKSDLRWVKEPGHPAHVETDESLLIGFSSFGSDLEPSGPPLGSFFAVQLSPEPARDDSRHHQDQHNQSHHD